ncbi:class I adenylate-forming enzyme family protein [Parafrankia sp. EUN1f]|uniref:class I adenylate-forming enzyme family protein n=1 Tax=Parafrankia sp. EUN1f TaxID=102897 RepID=UPI0001C45666|nr:class I adenylate-forming enzyme family protein [Parafrankia sp. EUN1f]EFC82804.1 AMP-dependent synthetase and ligase [Parafrankia sp. EUN1f]
MGTAVGNKPGPDQPRDPSTQPALGGPEPVSPEPVSPEPLSPEPVSPGVASPRRVSPELAERYRADGQWDSRGLADGVEAAAARRPGALALADNERELTCAQLAAAVAAGVDLLAAHGVRAGDGVVLVSGNTRHGVIAYHALLRAGATVVVLDRRCGAAEVRHALDVLPSRPFVIVPTGERDRLGEALTTAHILALDLFDGPATAGDPPTVRWAEPDRDRPAVILFSSGTTGRPKGVLHSLNTLTAGAANMARITSADESAVVFLVSPLTSITGLMQLHLAADQGGALVLEDRFEPTATLRRLNDVGATLLGGAPVIAERLLAAATRATPSTDDGSDSGAGRDTEGDAEADSGNGVGIGLRTLALGGSMLPRPLLELASRTFGIEIARVYGSSEAPNFSGSLPSDELERRLADDGALMPGGEVRVGSAAHPREGLLRGPNVFLGYLDPADDEAAFEGDWYRSGDQIDTDSGRLTVVGRLKEVVNRNGLKIALSEIDAAVQGLAGVTEFASFGLPDATTGERLAVAVVVADGATVTLDDVLTHLRAGGLAIRKLPEQLVRWDGPLPRTASGKIVRSTLARDAAAHAGDLAERLHDHPH